jgi:hypothetical protein
MRRLSLIRWCCLFLAVIVPGFALSQETGTGNAQPVVWIAPAPGLQPIRLDSVSIDVDVAGFVARTRMELVFINPNDRVLEGEFVFPLGPGQTVSGYELEVEGRMRQGVVVPKQIARVAFEDTIRQQIDPGLAELTQGNVFRTRLYPIPARGSKRIALSFEHVLDDAGDDYRYVLPLSFDQAVDRFAVRAQVALSDRRPDAEGVSPDPALRFERDGEIWLAEFERDNVRPQSELAFRVPKAGSSGMLAAADGLEPSVRSIVARVDTGRPSSLSETGKPKHIALFYDASASARDRDRERELAVLGDYFTDLDAVRVDLIAFRDTAEKPRRHRVRGADASALLTDIRALPLDGGSSYGAIDAMHAIGADLILVVGDGLSNFGDLEAKLVAPTSQGVPVYVLHAAQRADHARLSRIAQAGGGRVVDLLHVATDRAVAALRERPWQVLSIVDDGGHCRDFGIATPMPVDSHLVFSARCAGNGEIVLNFGRSGSVPIQRRLALNVKTLPSGPVADSVHRLWAQARIAQLEAQPSADMAAVNALALRHGVVTRYTSLLVLDRIEDYVRYGIEPKEDDLREQYRQVMAAQPKQLPDAGRAERIERLAAGWREFRVWHEQRHSWLETLLTPTATNEAARWRAVARSGELDAETIDKQAVLAASLEKESAALVKRWTDEGADPKQRQAWEREATALMLRIDALRRERLRLMPQSDELALDAPANNDADHRALDRVEVAGSTTAAEPARMAVEEVAPPAAAPAPEQTLGSGESQSAPQAVLEARIELSGWNPDTPYLKRIRAAADPYAAYLLERETHGDSPAFYLDVADHLREQTGQPALALRVLSNLTEIGFENTALVRVLAHRLSQWQHFDLARGQFEAALAQRPEEPQSHRDLALVLARLPEPDRARAIELLWTVATGDWHGRFPGIELIALHELNAIVAAERDGTAAVVSRLGIPPELLQMPAIDLRVVMTWDADNTDIDLWVIDPAGEKAYYGQNRTSSGGHVSNDFTQGYGPEVFTIARPLPGTYRVQAHYFGDRRQSLTGPVTLQLEFQTRYGRPDGQRSAVTRRLSTGKELIDIGEFTIAPAD